MARRTRFVAGACVGLLSLSMSSAVAHAATKTVDMGTPKSAQKELGERLLSDANAFFPSTVTIARGDTVRFVPSGFHTVDFPRRGAKPIGLAAPTGQKISGAVDAAGAPFWFNGQDHIGFAKPLLTSNFGKTLVYTGRRTVESGAPLTERPKAFSVRFPRTGSYTYFCDIHPGMKGTVRVLARGRRVPGRASDAARVRRQVAAALRTARALKETPPANNVLVGLAGRGGVEKFVFAPDKLTVAPGTTVTFSMDRGSYEVHTATTGPGNPEKEPSSFLGTLAKAFESPTLDPQAAVYPSDQPPAPAGLTPASHGNGFWNSGVLDASRDTPLPPANSVRFDAPGTYEFYCLIHPFMHATVTVQ